MYSNKDEWLAEGKRIREDANQVGSTTSETACLESALTRYRENQNKFGAIGARVWLGGCLETSQRDERFCVNTVMSMDPRRAVAQESGSFSTRAVPRTRQFSRWVFSSSSSRCCS